MNSAYYQIFSSLEQGGPEGHSNGEIEKILSYSNIKQFSAELPGEASIIFFFDQTIVSNGRKMSFLVGFFFSIY